MRSIRYWALRSPLILAVLGSGCSMDSGDSIRTNPPMLSAISPALGPTAGGIQIALDGQNFVAGSTVTVAGVAATEVSVASATRMSAMLPSKSGAWGKVPVIVQNPDGRMVSRDDLFGYHATSVNFSSGQTFVSSMYSSSVLAADFNGDQKLDLAIPNANGGVVVRLGDGRGGFETLLSVPTGVAPAIAVGDFNKDQKLDLVVSRPSNNSVDLFRGDGMGGFSAPTSLSVGFYTGPIAVGDFDGLGTPDIAVVERYGTRVCVLLGDGQGSFGAPNSFDASSDIRGIVAADFNGDGKPDLAVASFASNSVTVLLNNGMSFAPTMNFSVGSGPFDMAVGDFNGDRIVDLAVHNGTSQDVSVLLGNGMGGFGPATNLPALASRPPAVADFNGDLKLDLAVGGNQGVSIMLGNGRGGFSAAAFSPIFGTAMAAGDFNGDQKPDLVVVDGISSNPTGAVLINSAL